VGFTPFSFEATQQLKPGYNSLVARVDNKRAKEAVPTRFLTKLAIKARELDGSRLLSAAMHAKACTATKRTAGRNIFREISINRPSRC
jgi:hypothetical protein